MTVTKEMLEEAVLSYSQRKKKAQTLRKFAAKIQMARKRALKRLATGDSLEIRARRAAVKIVRRLVAGRMGLKYAELSIGQKIEIDKKVSKRTKLIDKISGRLLPKIRAKEVARFKSQHTPLKEKAGAGEDGTDELVQTYVEDTPYQGNPFLPGMVLNKEYYFEKYGTHADSVMEIVMKTSERARKTDDS